MSESVYRPTFAPHLFYRDPEAALDWLARAFGFETSLMVEGPGGALYSEMTYGDGYIMVSSEWEDPEQPGRGALKSPASLGGAGTQALEVQVVQDIDGHCAQARAAGAVITNEPADQFNGSRTYRALDLEGHVWTFVQVLREVTFEELEREHLIVLRGMEPDADDAVES